MTSGPMQADSCVGDPVATRILSNVLEWMGSEKARSLKYGILGDADDLSLMQQLGSSAKHVASPEQLAKMQVAIIGKTGIDPTLIKEWVDQGGTAVVLPQAQAFYQTALPGTEAILKTTNFMPIPQDLKASPLFAGIGESDFHSRQPLPLLTFKNGSDVVEVPSGKGRWVLVGFDPRKLNLAEEPYLRLTYRHQSRALAQLLTNIGVSLASPMKGVWQEVGGLSFAVDVTEEGKALIRPKTENTSPKWIESDFDDKEWTPFTLLSKHTAYGDACLRIKFSVPSEVPKKLVADLGTMDDYDESYLNGVKIGSINAENSQPDKAFATRRVYPIPEKLIQPGRENVLAIHLWNRNAKTQGWIAWLRGPLKIHALDLGETPYIGSFKNSDDPYLQCHW